MRRYSILGISLIDFTARESLKQIDRFLGGGVMNTVTYITAQTLAESAKEETVKRLLEETDLTVCVESDILEAAGIASTSRLREIEERVVLRECLKKVTKSGGSIYLLGDTEKEAQLLEEMVRSFEEDVTIAGCSGYDAFEGQPEPLMNALNEAAPKIIFSRMAWPQDLELMHQGKKFLNAKIWVALPEKELPKKAKPSVLKKIRRLIFRKKVNEYNQWKAD